MMEHEKNMMLQLVIGRVTDDATASDWPNSVDKRAIRQPPVSRAV